MTSNQRIDEFLKLQDKGISLDEIASTLGIKPQTLKRDLNKNGYKSVKGKYIKKDEKSQNVSIQVSFVDNELNQKNNEKKAKKTTPKKTKVAEQNNKNEKVKVKNTKTSKTKKDKDKYEEQLKEFVDNVTKTFSKEINERGCIGSIAEIYDSKRPYAPKGAFAQAWSVAEVFRIILGV